MQLSPRFVSTNAPCASPCPQVYCGHEYTKKNLEFGLEVRFATIWMGTSSPLHQLLLLSPLACPASPSLTPAPPSALFPPFARLPHLLPLAPFPRLRLVLPRCGRAHPHILLFGQVEPHNAATLSKMEWARAQLSEGADTVPSTIEAEREHNVFMRVGQQEVQDAEGTGGRGRGRGGRRESRIAGGAMRGRGGG